MDHVILSHYSSVDSAIIDEIRAGLGPDAAEESRESPNHFASVEWLLLTAVFLHYTKPYFEAFQKEAGKHHYDVLKRTAAKCWHYFFGKTPKYTFALKDMKGRETPSRFSLTFSIMADTNTPYKAKLLLDKTMSQAEMEAASASFVAAMAAHHSQRSTGIISDLTRRGTPDGGLFLVRYDISSATLLPVSPVPWNEDYPG